MKTDKIIKVHVNKSNTGKSIKTTTRNGKMVELKVLKVVNRTDVNEISKLINGTQVKDAKYKYNIVSDNASDDELLQKNNSNISGKELPLTAEGTEEKYQLKIKTLGNEILINNITDANSLQSKPVPSNNYSDVNSTTVDTEMSATQYKAYPKNCVDIGCQTDFNVFTLDEMIELAGFDIDSLLSGTNNFVPPNLMHIYEECKKALVLDQFGNLPIHVAVLSNNLMKVKLNCLVFKKMQISVNLRNKQNETPLQIAVKETKTSGDLINVLLQFGANITDIDEDGNNIIHLAIIHERKDIFEYLLQCARSRKIDLDLYNYEGQTPLLLSIMNGSSNMEFFVKLLLKNNAQPDLQDKKSGKTPLFHAAEAYNESLVELLLENGADPKIKNYFGTSPYDATFELEDIPQSIKNLVLKKVKVYDKIMKNASAQVKKQINKKLKLEENAGNLIQSGIKTKIKRTYSRNKC